MNERLTPLEHSSGLSGFKGKEGSGSIGDTTIIFHCPGLHTQGKVQNLQRTRFMDLHVMNGIRVWNFHFHARKFRGQPHGKCERLAFFTMHHKDFSGMRGDRPDIGQEIIPVGMSGVSIQPDHLKHAVESGFQRWARCPIPPPVCVLMCVRPSSPPGQSHWLHPQWYV